MIKDTLSNAKNYYNISKRLETGFEWLNRTNLQNVSDGKYLIDGEDVYANVQSYVTKDDAPYEAHRKYIDIQYMIKGEERVGVANYANCSTTETYDGARDLEFLKCEKDEWFETLKEGEFLVFFPNDAHKPSLDLNSKMNVKKIIVKVGI